MDKKIFYSLLALFILFTSSLASAVELNPFADEKIFNPTPTAEMGSYVKEDFNSKYGVIQLSKTFFWFESDKIAEYSLTKNTEICLINCEAEGRVTLYEDGILFDGVAFKTLTGLSTSIKSSEYLIFEGYQDNFIDMPTSFKEVCTTDPVSGKHCEQIPQTFQKVNQPIELWGKYNGEVLKAGDYRWKIKGIKSIGQSVDFIPLREDKEFSEWAIWTNSLNVGLVAGYTLNNTGADYSAPDVLGHYNGSSSSIPDWRTGIIGNAFNCTNTRYIHINDTDDKFDFQNGNFSYSFWIKPEALSDFVPVAKFSNTFSYNVLYSGGVLYDDLYMPTNRRITNSSSGIALNKWMHLAHTFLSNGSQSASFFYINGTLSGALYNIPEDKVQATTANISFCEDEFGGGRLWFKGQIDEVYFYNRTLSGAEVNDLYNGGAGITYNPNIIDNAPVVFMDSPANSLNFSTSPQTINFLCNVTDDNAVQNLTLKAGANVYNLLGNGTATKLNASQSYTFTDGKFSWNCTGFDYANQTAVTNRIFEIDSTAPILQLNTPANNSVFMVASLPSNFSFSFNATDRNLATCSYNSTFNITSTTVTCNSTQLIDIPNNSAGVNYVYYCANDTFANINCSSIKIRVGYYPVYHYSNKLTMGEGNDAIFTFIINGTDINSEFATTNATLRFNNTLYAPDSIDRTAQNYTIFSKTLTMPIGSGNSSGIVYYYNWSYNLQNASTVVLNGTTSSNTLKVYNVYISDCGIEAGKVILNLSLKDEETTEYLSTSSPNQTTIELDLRISSPTNSTNIWYFSKKWVNNNTALVCVPYELLNTTTYRIDFTAGFDGTDHVREFFYLDNGTLNNSDKFNSYTSHNIDLLDLLTTDSTTFLFSFTDSDGLEVDNALIHTYRKYIGEGLFREVERSKQDNNGQTHVHLVEEDVIYYFMVSQYGNIIYISDTYNAKCLATPCEITLSASAVETNWSIIDNEGGAYSVTTNKATRIVTTAFNLDSINLVNVSLYKIVNGNASLVNKTSMTAMSGSIPLHVPLAYGNASFFVVIYKNNIYVKSEWVDLTESAKDYFGTMGAIMGGLIVVSIGLMAVSEGAGLIVFTCVAVVIVGVMSLVDLGWLAIISLVCAGGILLWKLVSRRKNG